MCEECDTWQHIICYYPNELVPAVHFCEVCGSRYQDAKRATKRQKVVHKVASPGNNPSDARKPQSSDRSVAETVFTRRGISPDLGSRAVPNVVATIGEQEPGLDDEPLISQSSKATGVSAASEEMKLEASVIPFTGGRLQAMSGGEATLSRTAFIDLTHKTEDAVSVKIEHHDDQTTEDATTLLS
jgi:hypothetical protein